MTLEYRPYVFLEDLLFLSVGLSFYSPLFLELPFEVFL